MPHDHCDMDAETVGALIEDRFAELWDRKESARLYQEWSTYKESKHRLSELERLYEELFGEPVPL
jgi:hypothetical protein